MLTRPRTPLTLRLNESISIKFDLVVGNPPYVRQEELKAVIVRGSDGRPRPLKDVLKGQYECFTGTADLYVYFYERAVKLLGHGGVISFISSNKFFRAGYGEKLRNYLREKTELQTVIDFGDLPIFEAVTYPCIVVARNREPDSERNVRTLNVKTMNELAVFTELATKAVKDTAAEATRNLAGATAGPSSGSAAPAAKKAAPRRAAAVRKR